MIFVSCYTKNYKHLANRLEKSLIKFGLQHYLKVMKDSKDSNWQKNTNAKVPFVKDCLLKFKEPVCWLDADCAYGMHGIQLLGQGDGQASLAQDFDKGEQTISHMRSFLRRRARRLLSVSWLRGWNRSYSPLCGGLLRA